MTFQEIVLQAIQLPPAQRLSLIEALSRSVRADLRPRSAPGRQLMHLAGTISSQDAQLMREAIEKECERVELTHVTRDAHFAEIDGLKVESW